MGIQLPQIIVLKFGDFYLTQILRETKWDNFVATKTAILTDLEALEFDFQPISALKSA